MRNKLFKRKRQLLKEQQENERQVWASAWCACANADNCDSTTVAKTWADRCLKDYQKKFYTPQPPSNS